MDERCPRCGFDLFYTEDGQQYSHAIGVEIPVIYDGVLFWQCPACDGRWHRFPPTDRLYQRAEDYVNHAGRMR